MLALTRKTDYALIALCHLARQPERVISARQIARRFSMPLPLLMNVLKTLAAHEVVRSVRGAKGGYQLARRPEDLTLDLLLQRARNGVKEVILYTNPDLEGDVTAQHIAKLLRPLGIKVTLPARGIPTGSHIEYSSDTILRDALDGRHELGS